MKKMIIEQFIFITVAFGLFVYMFFELIRKNDTKYVPILSIEALRNSNRLLASMFFKRWIRSCYANNNLYTINHYSNTSYYTTKSK